MQHIMQNTQILSHNLSGAGTTVHPVIRPSYKILNVHDMFRSCQYPFGPPFDEFVEHDADIIDDESTDVESEKLGCVLNAELKPKVRLRRMLQSRIFDLSSNVICMHLSVKPRLNHRRMLRIMLHTQNLNSIAELRKCCHVIGVRTTVLHLAEFSPRKFGVGFIGHG